MTTLVAVRHGQTVYNRQNRIQGWVDSQLTDRGREQARDLAATIDAEHDIDRTVASDLDRARETAAIVAGESDAPSPELDEGLRERHAGVYQDRTRAEIQAEAPGAISDGGHIAIHDPPAEGEAIEEMRERVLAAVDRAVDGLGADETVLVVAHGGPVRALLSAATDTDLAAAYDRFVPGNCSRSVLAVDGGLELIETDTV